MVYRLCFVMIQENHVCITYVCSLPMSRGRPNLYTPTSGQCTRISKDQQCDGSVCIQSGLSLSILSAQAIINTHECAAWTGHGTDACNKETSAWNNEQNTEAWSTSTIPWKLYVTDQYKYMYRIAILPHSVTMRLCAILSTSFDPTLGEEQQDRAKFSRVFDSYILTPHATAKINENFPTSKLPAIWYMYA